MALFSVKYKKNTMLPPHLGFRHFDLKWKNGLFFFNPSKFQVVRLWATLKGQYSEVACRPGTSHSSVRMGKISEKIECRLFFKIEISFINSQNLSSIMFVLKDDLNLNIIRNCWHPNKKLYILLLQTTH